MNKLSHTKRVQILSMLCEGSSMQSTARVADVSINTVTKLLEQAGAACEAFHDMAVRNVASKRIQCDEIWSFVYAKAKNVETAKAAPAGAGDIWTWTAIDADTKLIPSFLCRQAGQRGRSAFHQRSGRAPRQPRATDQRRPQAIPGSGGGGVRRGH